MGLLIGEREPSLPISDGWVGGWVGSKGFGGSLPATPKCLFLIPNVYFQLLPSQPPNFLQAGTKDPFKCPWSWEGGKGDMEPVLYQSRLEGGWIKRLPGSPPVSTGPAQA